MAWSHLGGKQLTLSIFFLLLLCHALQTASAPTNQTITITTSPSSSYAVDNVIRWRITNTNLVLEIIHVPGTLAPQPTYRFLTAAQEYASIQPRTMLIGALGWDFGPQDGLFFTLEENEGSPLSWLVASNVVRGVLQYILSDAIFRPLTFTLVLRGTEQVLGQGALVQIISSPGFPYDRLDGNHSSVATSATS